MIDVPLCSEEIDGGLRRLKSAKFAGHDLLLGECAEHTEAGNCDSHFAREVVRISLTPTATGVTLTPVLAKVLESLILECLQDVLMERGIPHLKQTG